MMNNFNRTVFKILLLVSVVFYTCSKKPDLPSLTTALVTEITQTSAVSGGNVTSDGGASIVSRGVCWNTSSGPTVDNYKSVEGGELGPFVIILERLTPNTTYFVRAYAINEAGTSYGNEVQFSTLPVLSVIITTRDLTYTGSVAAVTGGNVISDGGCNIISKGVCWDTTEFPTTEDFKTNDGSGLGVYNSYLTGLMPGTTYYARAYATNIAGTAYGNQIIFTTSNSVITPPVFRNSLSYDSIPDIEGNYYKTIRIFNQTWFAENLRVTKYNDGSPILNITSDESWTSSVVGAYCWYNNDISNKNIYGALYNWYAVSTGKLCPSGWHIPSPEEWLILAENAGGMAEAGGRIKEAGTCHWIEPNTGSTNETGFTAVPGGIRTVSGYFEGIGLFTRWWKSSGENVVEVSYDSGEIKTEVGCVYRRGLAVRCIKD